MTNITITDRSGVSAAFSAAPGERLLHAGLAAGYGLPHECASGTCGSCKALVVNGRVERLWPEAPGTKSCRKENEVLLCQSAADENEVELSLRSAFIAPCEPPCGKTSGVISLSKILTPEVALFEVRLGGAMAYRPGQFALLSGFGIEGPRAYSMIRDEPRDRLNFLVRKGSGAFTKALFEGGTAMPVTVFGPLGRATFSGHENRPFVALAGGSGIAGILSILHHAQREGHYRNHASSLFFGLRNQEESYLLGELSEAAAQSGNKLKVTVVFSDAPCTADFSARYPLLRFSHGFVSDAFSRSFAQEQGPADMEHPIYFVAGPPPMVNATMRALMIEAKVNPAEIRYDRFG